MLLGWDSLQNKMRLIQSTDVGWIAGPGREWQQYRPPLVMVTERNASRKWKCCKTVSKGDDAVKSEVEQGYALDQAMISIFSIFRSKAGVKLTFYWWLILLRCCLSVAATQQISSQWRSCGKKYKAGRNWYPLNKANIFKIVGQGHELSRIDSASQTTNRI